MADHVNEDTMSGKRATLIAEFDERIRSAYAALNRGDITNEQLEHGRAEIDSWYGREVAKLAAEARPAALFCRCGIALFGPDPFWKAPLAAALGTKTETINRMATGERRVPPGVWVEIRTLLQNRFVVMPQLTKAIDLFEPASAESLQEIVSSTPRHR